LPHKKPNKSKHNPNPTLTEKQKKENKEMSRERVIVEHVIGGMKRYRCLVDKFRNKKEGVKDLFSFLAAILWNFNMIYLKNKSNDVTANNHDVLHFLDDINHDQLWFSKQKNNLQIDLIGTSDQIKIISS